MCIVAMRGRNPNNPSDRTAGSLTEQRLEVNMQGTSNCLTSVQKDNLLFSFPLMDLISSSFFSVSKFSSSIVNVTK